MPHGKTYAARIRAGRMLDAQLKQLRAEGCAKIYREKQSGARADRHELLKLLKAIEHGDVVMVTRIDRLARSTFDLFAIVKRIVDAGAQFRQILEMLPISSNSVRQRPGLSVIH